MNFRRKARTGAIWSAPLVLLLNLAACEDENTSDPADGGSEGSSSGSSTSSTSSTGGATSSGAPDSGAHSVEVSLSSSALELAPGSTLSVDVVVTTEHPVDLSVLNLPLGVAGTFSPVVTGTTSVLTLTAALDAAPASVSLLVRASGAEGTATAQASLSVLAPSTDYAVFAVPSAVTLHQGRSAPLQLSVARHGAFSGDVTLSFGDLPVGVRIEPSTLVLPSGVASGAVTLTVSQEATPSSSATIAIHGAGGGGAEGSFSLQIPARPGSVDTTFGAGGSIVTQAKFTSSFGIGDLHYARTADGKLVVCGLRGQQYAGVARLLADGALDPAFNDGEPRTLPIGGGFSDQIVGCGAQDDGKIVIAMRTGAGTMLGRLMPSGEVDTTYGVDGYTLLAPAVGVDSMRLLPDGRLLLGCSGHDAVDNPVAVARLTGAGALDPTFGSSGFALRPSSVAQGTIAGITLQGNDIVVGASFYDGQSRGALLRFTDAGVSDPSFGEDGVVFLETPAFERVTALTAQPDGKLLVSGVPDSTRSASVARLLPDGELDPAFGIEGTRWLGYDAQWIASITPLADGSIAVAGKGKPSPSEMQFYVAKLTSGGAFDMQFNGKGWMLATPSPALTSQAAAVYELDDGKLLLAGSADLPPSAALVRVWP